MNGFDAHCPVVCTRCDPNSPPRASISHMKKCILEKIKKTPPSEADELMADLMILMEIKEIHKIKLQVKDRVDPGCFKHLAYLTLLGNRAD
jgi:hypothetical protein